jgi:chromosomal replication initiation ATPase DnaA
MKTYDRHFLQRLAKNLNIAEKEFNQKLYETEKQITGSMPEKFDYDELVELTCDEYKITADEFHSFYRYGELGKARQTVCYLMSLLGFKNNRIAKVTGFKHSNISASIRIISADLNALNHVNAILEKLRIYEEI